MTKKELRNQVLEQLRMMNKDTYRTASETIIEQLRAQTAYQDAEVIGVTISRFPEVDTKLFIQTAWADGKKVAIPKCLPRTRAMDFRKMTSYDELAVVYMDLLEPIVDETIAVSKEKIDLLIVPGVVYSNEGYRIGFGGGYYDRYLADYGGRTISLAFSCQLNQNIQVEAHDLPVEMIITENEIIDCQRK